MIRLDFEKDGAPVWAEIRDGVWTASQERVSAFLNLAFLARKYPSFPSESIPDAAQARAAADYFKARISWPEPQSVEGRVY